MFEDRKYEIPNRRPQSGIHVRPAFRFYRGKGGGGESIVLSAVLSHGHVRQKLIDSSEESAPDSSFSSRWFFPFSRSISERIFKATIKGYIFSLVFSFFMASQLFVIYQLCKLYLIRKRCFEIDIRRILGEGNLFYNFY